MTIDRTLNLRPGVIDIANNVDNLLSDVDALFDAVDFLTGVTYDSSDLTFRNDFEPYNDNSTQDVIEIMKIGALVSIHGSVKKTTAQSVAGNLSIAALPSELTPRYRQSTINAATGMNRYMTVVNTDGLLSLARFGIDTNVGVPANTWLRIDITYVL